MMALPIDSSLWLELMTISRSTILTELGLLVHHRVKLVYGKAVREKQSGQSSPRDHRAIHAW